MLGSKRMAYLGVFLTMLLPVILCEYIYLNEVAVPDWRRLTWETSVEAYTGIPVPSFAVFGSRSAYSIPPRSCPSGSQGPGCLSVGPAIYSKQVQVFDGAKYGGNITTAYAVSIDWEISGKILSRSIDRASTDDLQSLPTLQALTILSHSESLIAAFQPIPKLLITAASSNPTRIHSARACGFSSQKHPSSTMLGRSGSVLYVPIPIAPLAPRMTPTTTKLSVPGQLYEICLV